MVDDDGDRQRLFIGIPLTDEVRERNVSTIRKLDDVLEGVRWVLPENLHVTLKFLGDCESSMLGGLKNAIEQASAYLPLELTIGGVGGFPSQGSARIIWVGAAEKTGALQSVFETVERGVKKCGIDKERRRYRPHVTIGRARRSSVALPNDASGLYQEGPMAVDELLLYSSVLSGGPPEYRIIGRAHSAR